ncbi:hypothetical protein CHLRE_03g192676v5 [Chlamydomonas reinhardtii]|uniref:Uncharacterized protein n=1 Tax=Chlamydomonas reinhardtii TaxID=3055 RepID=A0A2K3DYG6_CHLRE|nr:uncharacterized protein CHLRE_03g192676v5 [Chlamydomonas reinhardtii]PNW85565.1 hypothetical protein CHLRE_03g192676v5 [Chlamydomonas reinhardtii]
MIPFTSSLSPRRQTRAGFSIRNMSLDRQMATAGGSHAGLAFGLPRAGLGAALRSGEALAESAPEMYS